MSDCMECGRNAHECQCAPLGYSPEPVMTYEDIRGRLEAITPGPWKHDGLCVDAGHAKFICTMGEISTFGHGYDPFLNWQQNIAFIANCPTDIAFLLSECDRKDEALRQQKILIAWLAGIVENPRSVNDEQLSLAMKAVETALKEQSNG